MKKISIIDLKRKIIERFYSTKYYSKSIDPDFISDDLALDVFNKNLENFTDEEILYVHRRLGLESSGTSDLNCDKKHVLNKMNKLIKKSNCEKNGLTSIYDLNLSARINNALERKGIYSIEQLQKCDEKFINDLRNLGPIHIKELKDKMHEYEFKSKLESSKEKQEKNIEQNLEKSNNKTDLTIEDLNLSYSILVRNGIFTISQLKMYGAEELKELRRMGDKSFEELIDKVHEKGEKFVFDYPLELQPLIYSYEKKIYQNQKLIEEYKREILENKEQIEFLDEQIKIMKENTDLNSKSNVGQKSKNLKPTLS